MSLLIHSIARSTLRAPNRNAFGALPSYWSVTRPAVGFAQEQRKNPEPPPRLLRDLDAL